MFMYAIMYVSVYEYMNLRMHVFIFIWMYEFIPPRRTVYNTEINYFAQKCNVE